LGSRSERFGQPAEVIDERRDENDEQRRKDSAGGRPRSTSTRVGGRRIEVARSARKRARTIRASSLRPSASAMTAVATTISRHE